MIAAQYITKTGVYWNPDEYRHEAWIVNKATGEKRCIGWLRDDGRGSDDEMRRRYWWEKEIWPLMLPVCVIAEMKGKK